jgi:hypothetical protein
VIQAISLALACAILLVSPASAEDVSAYAEDLEYPATADVVAGAEACAVRSMSEPKMLERLTSLGWEQKASRAEPGFGNLTLFRRNHVQLTYFHAKIMKQCIVTARADPAATLEGLLTGLTALFGKPPKIETPGRRYLYFLPRLDILTLQVKPSPAGSNFELSVVH